MNKACFVTFLTAGVMALPLVGQADASLVLDTVGDAEVVTFDSTRPGVNAGAYNGSGLGNPPASGQLDSTAFSAGPTTAARSAFGSDQVGTFYANGLKATNAEVQAFTGSGLLAVAPNAANGRAYAFKAANNNDNPNVLRVLNDTGTTLTSFDVSLATSAFNYGSNSREATFAFSYSLDDPAYIADAALDITSLNSDTQNAFVGKGVKSTTINATVADGDFLYLRYTYAAIGGGGTDRPMFALDNISVTGNGVVPEPASAALLAAGALCLMPRRCRPA